MEQHDLALEQSTVHEVETIFGIPVDSPLLPLYMGETSLDRFLHIDGIGEERVHFSEALRALRDTSGISTVALGKHAKSGDRSIIPHIINRSSGRKAYMNTEYPPVTAEFLMRIGRQFGEGGEEMSHNSRIPIVFYDTNGDLILRNYRDCGAQGSTEIVAKRAQAYLTATQEYVGFGLNYIAGLLRDRHNALKSLGEIPRIPEDDQLAASDRGVIINPRRHLTFGLGSKIGVRLRQVTRALGVFPVYLVFPPNREEVADSRQVILDHIERIYSRR